METATERKIEHVCCGQWFGTMEEVRAHMKESCPVILKAKRDYKPITVYFDGKAITARTPAWERGA